MVAATLAMLLFALSSVAAKRSIGFLGSTHANLARIVLATVLLGAWAHTFGGGFRGPALGWFVVSGVIGFGICDTAIFLALPRLGAQLTSLMVQCLAAPIAALTEWIWLGTRLSPGQVISGTLILAGVGVALAPQGKGTPATTPDWVGYALGFVAAAGQAFGAVLSRHGQLLSRDAGFPLDGMTVAYQRILAGLVFTVAWWWWARRNRVGAPPAGPIAVRLAIPWILINAFSGPSLGVAAYQWALLHQPTGVVVAVTALTPLAVIPFAWWLDGERPKSRSVLGAVLAVAGAVALALVR
ncbi:MAG TPA: DMT family transporter [Verrucomicrobiota bacterium]|nr:EamA family transporter [Verrucomicrobiales bacterium]HRI16169.1 DMT family transporter [Verrucomicrobiota bacterium]